MQYLQFRERFKPLEIFSVNEVQKAEKYFDRKQLVRWQEKGYLHKIINRWYCFSGMNKDETFLFLTANRIYAPSYVSFESALSWYGLIPEGVYSITSATTLKTNIFKTPLATFSYRHLKPALMFGYSLIQVGNKLAKMAEPEKALLDFLYLNQKINSKVAFEALRINKQEFKNKIVIKRLLSYLVLYKNKPLEKRMDAFLKYMKHA